MFFTAVYNVYHWILSFFQQRDPRNYDREFLFKAAQYSLLESFLINRFPDHVSDHTVPLEFDVIPAPINTLQNLYPLTQKELEIRSKCMAHFLQDRYGNLKTFLSEVKEAFDSEDDEEPKKNEPHPVSFQIPDEDVESSESDSEENWEVANPAVPEPKKREIVPVPPKASPKVVEENIPEPKKREIVPVPPKAELIVEKDAPTTLDSESDESEKVVVTKFTKPDDDVDDDFLNTLIQQHSNSKKEQKSKTPIKGKTGKKIVKKNDDDDTD